MWLGFVGIAAYIPGVLLTELCQLEGTLFLVFLMVTVAPSKFSLWPEGEEQRGGHRAVRRSGMLKFPLAAGQEWCQSFLSIIPSWHPSLINVSGPAISLLLWFWEWKIGYCLPSKFVWLSGYIPIESRKSCADQKTTSTAYSVINFNIYAVPTCELEIISVTIGKERQEFQRAKRLSF